MLSSPVIRKAVKTEVLREVFGSNISPLTMDFPRLSTAKVEKHFYKKQFQCLKKYIMKRVPF